MAETAYIETEALLLAIEDTEADSGNHEPLDEYLWEHFSSRELRKLSEAIPPAYTEFIGTQLMAHLKATVAV